MWLLRRTVTQSGMAYTVGHAVQPCKPDAAAGLRFKSCAAAEKLEAAETQLHTSTRPARFMAQGNKVAPVEQQQLKKVARDASHLAVEQAKGLSTQVRPSAVFWA